MRMLPLVAAALGLLCLPALSVLAAPKAPHGVAVRTADVEGVATVGISPDLVLPWPRPKGVLVVRRGDGFRAFSNQSPHRGCRVEVWETGDRLYDVCSHAFWSLDGEPIAGPAPRGLDWYPVTVRGEWVEVDLAQLGRGESK